jgi:hypothetical protein
LNGNRPALTGYIYVHEWDGGPLHVAEVVSAEPCEGDAEVLLATMPYPTVYAAIEAARKLAARRGIVVVPEFDTEGGDE